jgi:AraC family ethanolamine operon transcriptional activator
MSVLVQEPLTTQQHFSNFDVFSSAISGYDMEVKQIGRGSFSAYMQQIQYGPISISRFTGRLRVEANGMPPAGMRTFGVPTKNCQPFIWRDKQTSGNTIQIYKPDTELAVITAPAFEAIDISLPEDDFNNLNNIWGFPDLARLIQRREMVKCEPAKMQQLRRLLIYICSTIDKEPDSLRHDTTLQNLVSYQVPYLLAKALMTSTVQKIKATTEKRNKAIKTATDYIDSSTDTVISIQQLCRDTGINKRTLERAFLDNYGMTPKSYLQSLRLNDAYKTLSQSDPETTKITDIAIGLGYWHMSQFAVDYRRQFGELPSTTLKSTRLYRATGLLLLSKHIA